jgi:hypothetical protein
MKSLFALAVVLCLSLGFVLAQDEPTPTPSFGPITTTQPTLEPVPAVEPDTMTDTTEQEITGQDARLAACSAPTLPDFAPYTIRRGDTLGALLTGVDNLTVTQLAVLNCIDDPTALPVGATIWLPFASAAVGGGVQTAVTPSVTPVEGEGAVIRSFTSSADEIQNQATVTFTWDAAGVGAYLYQCPADETQTCTRPAQITALPVTGALALTDFRYAGPVRFRLEVVGGEQPVTEDLVINITCSQAWMGAVTGNTLCADDPAIATFGAWQPFEGGVMLYFGDTGEIYVMTNDDRRVQVFQDTFVEGMEEPETSDIPDGRFAARRGFGIVWRELGGPESLLRWGLGEEIGFDSAHQAAGRISYTTYIQGPGDTVYAVTLIPDTNIGFWTSVNVLPEVTTTQE